MNPRQKANFSIFTPLEFIAAITQHIPEKNFQLVRYYGWYSNKSRGQRAKDEAEQALSVEQQHAQAEEVILIKEEERRRIPSKTWRELIKKVWEVDPLLCPHCKNEMRIIALINEAAIIEKILKHLGLWRTAEQARAPPDVEVSHYESFYEDMPFQQELYM